MLCWLVGFRDYDDAFMMLICPGQKKLCVSRTVVHASTGWTPNTQTGIAPWPCLHCQSEAHALVMVQSDHLLRTCQLCVTAARTCPRLAGMCITGRLCMPWTGQLQEHSTQLGTSPLDWGMCTVPIETCASCIHHVHFTNVFSCEHCSGGILYCICTFSEST